MSRLRKLIPVLAVVAAMLVAAVPVLAQMPPALYMCTVYEDGAHVGAGKQVEAFVGKETTARGSATTNADGIAVVQFTVVAEDIGEGLSFKVDGNAATEAPDVDVSIEGLAVGLYRTAAAPRDDAAASPRDDTAAPPRDDTAAPPRDDTAAPPPDDTAVSPPDDTAVSPPDDAAPSPPGDTAPSPPDDTALPPAYSGPSSQSLMWLMVASFWAGPWGPLVLLAGFFLLGVADSGT